MGILTPVFCRKPFDFPFQKKWTFGYRGWLVNNRARTCTLWSHRPMLRLWAIPTLKKKVWNFSHPVAFLLQDFTQNRLKGDVLFPMKRDIDLQNFEAWDFFSFSVSPRSFSAVLWRKQLRNQRWRLSGPFVLKNLWSSLWCSHREEPCCVATHWTQLTYRFHRRTV